MGFALESEPWMLAAKCRGMDTALWFPVRGESQKIAKAICSSCPVSQDCWDYSQRTDSQYGIWGGKIIKRGRNKIESYPWDTIYLNDDLYWDGYVDETGELVS